MRVSKFFIRHMKMLPRKMCVVKFCKNYISFYLLAANALQKLTSCEYESTYFC